MTLAHALWFLAGLFIGTNLGVLLMCLLQINREPPTPEETRDSSSPPKAEEARLPAQRLLLGRVPPAADVQTRHGALGVRAVPIRGTDARE